jgi:hypothetical protein
LLATPATLVVVRWIRRTGPSTIGCRMPAFGRLALALPAVAAVALVPWTIGIATRLPHSPVVRHWNTDRAGLDVAIMVGLTQTRWLAADGTGG